MPNVVNSVPCGVRVSLPGKAAVEKGHRNRTVLVTVGKVRFRLTPDEAKAFGKEIEERRFGKEIVRAGVEAERAAAGLTAVA